MSLEEIWNDPEIQAVVIATSPESHFSLASAALEHGKHVFVEKPLSKSSQEAEDLIKLANLQSRNLFVGHIFLYHPCFIKLKSLLNADNAPINLIFSWQKEGAFNCDILDSLAVHDIAMAATILGFPLSVQVAPKRCNLVEVAFFTINMSFEGNAKCTIQLNRMAAKAKKNLTVITRADSFFGKKMNYLNFIRSKVATSLFLKPRLIH